MSKDTDPQHSEASPQHTPGPWHRCEAQPDAIVGPRCEPGTCAQCDELQLTFGELGPGEAWAKTYGDHFAGHFVCESVSSTANFNLIAAAPDLLAALRGAEKILTLMADDGMSPTLEQVQAAIAKAEGRQL